MMKRLSLLTILLLVPVVASALDLPKGEITTLMDNQIILADADNDNPFAGEEQKKAAREVKSDPNYERKSLGKALLYSALLPGLGENYVGHKTKAKIFFGVEISTWIAYASFRTWGSWRKDDMVKFAADKAGVNLDGRDEIYEDMVGFYNDVDEYNNAGRVDDEERPYYDPQSANAWYWQSDDDRVLYRSMKNRYRDAYRKSDFMIGVAIVNRLISMIDAARDVRRHNNRQQQEFSWFRDIDYAIDVEPVENDTHVMLVLSKRF
jgi:hypothetical protein